MSLVAHALICKCAEVGILNITSKPVENVSWCSHKFKTEKKVVLLGKVFLFDP